ncbi:MAG: ribosome recycling factor [Bacteroidetes bacterium GWF2_42_66]|nr:MAG: ribosome recycling factor [Bacteroidetes bacterium GWA2_42_15]OFY02905.1 MAG: ribosome recycling factor [Bacteroidetes bacterium GWE2_42_39]OFY44560.1 MAG: ribosome recycling factor [Bacteroidetes bacterium GWF2_42_66]HBL74881.1 ribosome recycling factor [Prolixibacteraceae bacterium]HCR91730.1 ribosome recycling factor [Prolixibacteraceae bacterium]
MQEEVDLVLDMCKDAMEHAIAHLEKELAHIRAGKASPRMLDSVTVDYYGSMVPLAQVSNVNTPDARTIAIQPWEKKMIPIIEKAIMAANLGFNPDNNGEIIRINIPPLTEERRRDMVKLVNKEGENAKISIRSARKDSNESLKKLQKEGLSEDLEKDAEDEVQEMTTKYSKLVDDMMKDKNDEILKI